MDQENILSKLSEAVFEGEEELVPELTNKAVDAGIEPLGLSMKD